MYHFLIVVINIVSICWLFAQVQTASLPPKPGFEKRIKEAVNNIWLIDTHEHLKTETERLKMGKIDVGYLFMPYAANNMIASGMEPQMFDYIENTNIPLEDRWNIIKKFWPNIRCTGYGRAPLIAANDLFGISDINDETYIELSKKINESNKPGWYKHVLKDMAKIELSIVDRRFDKKELNESKGFFVHVDRFQQFVWVFSAEEIKKVGNRYDIKVQVLDDYLRALDNAFIRGLEIGMVGVKSALAYNRTLNYENVTREKAEYIFNQLLSRGSTESKFTFDEVKPLQDYMMYRILDLAKKHRLPVQIHTGLHSISVDNITNTIIDSNPALLRNLFLDYPEITFCLFHGGYPYGGELATLGNNFQNVYIDLCWVYVISPTYAERYLHEWLETIPANKILAFGGDYRYVELAYAHSKIAREIVSKVLIEKVASQYITEEEAIYIARRILRENAIDIFHLEDKLKEFKQFNMN